ncbi:anhydro-N-acetylmuramic acid kinase [Vibrio sp. V05_P4A8T149]|nr:anhydro-N-acetylmuramic acid kinase [Vibrio anguillarum]NAW91209.1 anhydro-N-acetylmuramic acid kinase [Vibrio sp. V24_P1S3T111]NNN97270.1 anhydro-N-acetylmuramic acid kinase [Vibrio sp. B4-6]OXX26193.1 anhydro-N-acetylmuramic acid kinase [Vibrio sp. V06_P1A73T115]OXX26369.1 anhydro-N-acetylmuramic acid kinase [Vibrio sp. V05_P4A8T149]OXX31072.1 anhydro-N-acetylmuramic acid kinase [Vibrio sp. V04_P4A5T148]OXX35758.1 anhydro-N-acetylmuramic acid kinase [Vibrio sp. V14_P6S14T42]OXX52497.1 a
MNFYYNDFVFELKEKRMKSIERYIGVMSGTSMDGVDTALVEMDGNQIRLLAHADFPMPEDLKQRLLNVCIGQSTNVQEIGELDHLLGHLFADAVIALLAQSGYQACDIRAIGCHGQTVFHQPNGNTPFTMQLGDANIISNKTGIDTVADFRRKDMALGGQGAPLVPAFHDTIFKSTDSSVVVLNIGGIANISVLRPQQKVLGYDTGPGNILMDAWCFEQTGHKFDDNGMWARSGKVHQPLLERLNQEPYLALNAPKSTGRELFNLPWLQQILAEFSLAAEDVQRTLCEYTALTIATQVAHYQCGPAPELLLCGGGARNPLLVERLQAHLAHWRIMPTSDKGVDSDYMEAMAFAWLAQRRLHNLPSNLPEVTGASALASLGVVYFTH